MPQRTAQLSRRTALVGTDLAQEPRHFLRIQPGGILLLARLQRVAGLHVGGGIALQQAMRHGVAQDLAAGLQGTLGDVDGTSVDARSFRPSWASALAEPGSTPSDNKRRASSRFWRALDTGATGSTPSARRFSLPANRYFHSQYRPAAGVTSRYRPLASARRTRDLSSGHRAFLQATSFRAICGHISPEAPAPRDVTLQVPPEGPGRQETRREVRKRKSPGRRGFTRSDQAGLARPETDPWRRRRDSNPRYGRTRTPDFESGAFDHSATSPDAATRGP